MNVVCCSFSPTESGQSLKNQPKVKKVKEPEAPVPPKASDAQSEAGTST